MKTAFIYIFSFIGRAASLINVISNDTEDGFGWYNMHFAFVIIWNDIDLELRKLDTIHTFLHKCDPQTHFDLL